MLNKLALLCVFAAASAEYGFRMPQITRVIGGKNAHHGQFPYQVSLQIQYPGYDGQHFCGGSILTERLIITAANCIDYVKFQKAEKHFFVTAGILNLKSKNSTDMQTVAVEEFHVHHKYEAGTPGLQDFSVLVLASPLKFNELIAPIELPENEEIHDGWAILSGWGAIKTPNVSYPNILRYAELPLVPYPICKAVYDYYYKDNLIHDTNVCSGSLTGGKSACSGDVGGPLVQRDKDGKYKLIGVVSWVKIPCGSANSPSVYTKVSSYIDFINQIKALPY